ncbi:MAG: hypothetical protein ACOCYQ_06605, partial [Alkalispirochaeta sp.]
MFSMTELFGYNASFFVAISLLMSSFLWLRVLNLIGAVSFVIYGVLLGSIPVVITNGFITVINIYYLIRIFRPDLNGVQYVPVGGDRRERLDEFVSFYLDDIVRFFPDFSRHRIDECFAVGGKAYLAMKDLQLVGFTLVYPVPGAGVPASAESPLSGVYEHVRAHLFPERSAIIPVDYIVKKYRGLGLVQRLYRAIEEESTYTFLLGPVTTGMDKHRRFLEQNGYTRVAELDGYDLYAKTIG